MGARKILYLIILYIITCFPKAGGSFGVCQIGINATGASPDISSVLDIASNSKGVLIPRMSGRQRNALPSPYQSLLIFNTDDSCFESYMGTTWHSLFCSAACALPAQGGSISGATSVTQGETGVSYSVGTLLGATGYLWTYSGTGFSISTGYKTNDIIANFSGAASTGTYTISVYGTNSCGEGVGSNYTITVNP